MNSHAIDMEKKIITPHKKNIKNGINTRLFTENRY